MINDFKKLSSIISSIGNAGFPLVMYDLLDSYVRLDAMDIFKLAIDDDPSKKCMMQCYGSVFMGSRAENYACVTHYGSNVDGEASTTHSNICEKSRELIQSGQKKGTIYDTHSAGDQLLHYTPAPHRTSNYHIISLRRNYAHCHFSSIELNSLKDLLGVLPYFIDQHIEALSDHDNSPPGPDSEEDGLARLSNKLDARLEKNGIILSKREKQVCIMVLSGKTLPVIANELSLNGPTVATYLKRAGIKLGVSGRHGFVKWMQGT